MSHAVAVTHSGAGFGGYYDLSNTCPPLNKNEYSSILTLFYASNILIHICNDNRTLCLVNNPLQQYL